MLVQEVKNILEKVKKVPGLSQNLSNSADIIEDVGLDSLEMMEFMLEIESQLSLEIDFDKLEFFYFKSIDKFADFLMEMKK